ncbi:hypothetical protein FOCC_FOCC017490 [Frankliniella occidentalis]|nr:hypothetical protein FOCC_FOCC017490 [Frankliniella occidentalis]
MATPTVVDVAVARSHLNSSMAGCIAFTALATLLVLATANSHLVAGKGAGGYNGKGMSQDGAHTKLEQWLEDAVYLFRDKMNKSQPDLGLPVLDPFSLQSDKPIVVDNKAAHLDVTSYSVLAKSLSSLEVQDLSLYLMERTGVVDVSLKEFTADFGVVFAITHEGEGTSEHNPGLDELLSDLVRDLAPSLIEAWMPVLEKYVTALLDEKLQKVQISDLIPHD